MVGGRSIGSSRSCDLLVSVVNAYLLQQHRTLRFTLALLSRSKSLSDGLEVALEEANRLRSEREHFRRHLKRTERTREQEQLLSQNQEKTWATRVAEIERDCERQVPYISYFSLMILMLSSYLQEGQAVHTIKKTFRLKSFAGHRSHRRTPAP